MTEIDAAGKTHVGLKRRGNEDAFFMDDGQHLYVVADGMGGHQAGEVASALVVDTLRDYMRRVEESGGIEPPADLDRSLSAAADRLVAGIRIANRAVHDVANSNASYSGMGSTVSAVVFTDRTLVAANVGDSPIYRIHGGRIDLISVTHNVITEQMAINPDAARTIGPQFKHMLTRAMGIEANVEVDVSEIRFSAGDVVVISSDGLSDKVASGRDPASGRKPFPCKGVSNTGGHGQSTGG